MSEPYYSDDLVTLYHGDCREITDWLAADVLVTDPPYGIGYKTGGMSRARVPIVEDIASDADTSSRDAVLSMWGGGRAAVVFGSWRQSRPAGTTNRLIWHKAKSCPGMTTAAFFSAEEEIYLIGKGWRGAPVQNVLPTHEQRSNPSGLVARSGHPTPKPVGLMEHLIQKCPPGTIADPFAGSGSTLVAAKAQGRHAIGVEIEERYCEIAARRLDQGVLDFGEASA